MAFEAGPVFMYAEAASDLSAKQYFFVDKDATTDDRIAVVAAAGARALGVLYDKPAAAGRGCKVAIGGIVKVQAGGTITRGDSIKSNASGKAVTATKATVDTTDTSASDPVVGSEVLGIAMESAVDGDVMSILFAPRGAIPTTAA